MSIKTLNNGFKFKSSNLADIHRWIMEWRRELSVLHIAALSRLFAKLAVNMIDRTALDQGSFAGKTPLIETWSSVWDMQREVKAKGLRNPLVDFEFGISILPHEGSVYGIVFTERYEWFDLWLENDFVEEFAYWNSGDRPERFSEKEWSHRYDVWSAILETGSYRTPSMCGFYADCTHENVVPSTEDVIAAAPALDERVRELARLQVMGGEVQRRDELRVKGIPGVKPRGIPASDIFDLVSGVESWLRTDEGVEAMQDASVGIAAKLKPVITRDDLITALPAAQESEGLGDGFVSPRPEFVMTET